MPWSEPRPGNSSLHRRLVRSPCVALALVLAGLCTTSGSEGIGRVGPSSANAPDTYVTSATPVGHSAGPADELAGLLEQGQRQVRTGRGRLAETNLRQALALAEGLGDGASQRRSLRWLAEALSIQGRDPARLHQRLLQLSRRAGDREHEGWARAGLAQSALDRDDARGATAGFEVARGLFREARVQGGVARAVYGLGRAASAVGNSEEALRRYSEAESLARISGDAWLEGRILNTLGGRHFYTDPATAVRYWQRAIDAFGRGGDAYGTLTPRFNIALAHTHAGRLDHAAEALDSVLAVSLAEGYMDTQQGALRQMGIVRRLQGRMEESMQLLRGAFAMQTGTVGDRVDILWQMMQTTSDLGRPAEALDLLERGLKTFSPPLGPERRRGLLGIEGECLQKLGRPRDALTRFLDRKDSALASDSPVAQFLRFVPAAECYRDLGRPDSALIMLERASTAWESLRVVPKDTEWRAQRGAVARRLYENLAAILLSYPDSLPPDERAKRAFDAVQRFKARTLNERLTGPGRPATGAGDDRSTVSATALQRQVLRPGEVFLDAFVGYRDSYLFTVTRDTVVALRVPDLASLEQKIADYWTFATRRPPARAGESDAALAARAGGRLVHDLIERVGDLVANSPRVTVSWDSPLHDLPLGALPAPGPGGEPLLLAHQVCYVPSASTLAQLRGRRALGSSETRMLVIGGGRGANGDVLAGALDEAKWVSARYRHADLLAEGPDTTGLSERLSGYDVLHLASHIRSTLYRPWATALFVQAVGGTRVDSSLTAGRIAALELRARLCVLSGCESSSGIQFSGEGPTSLAASFIRAGVPCVIGSLWPVDDRVTARLIKRLYKNLEGGATAGEALRRAQLWMRATPATRHPFYWAGFIVVGDDEIRVPLERNPPRFAWLPVWLGLLACVAAGVGLRKRRLKPLVTAVPPVST